MLSKRKIQQHQNNKSKLLCELDYRERTQPPFLNTLDKQVMD